MKPENRNQMVRDVVVAGTRQTLYKPNNMTTA